MIRAFVAGIVMAIIAPLIGSFLVVRRFSLIADTLSHIALAGVAIGFILGTQPLVTTIVATTIAALLIEQLRRHQSIPADSILAMLLPGGLSLAIVLMSLTNGFNANLFSYLFGSITTVQPNEIALIVGLGVTTVAIVSLLYKKLVYAAIDEESALVSGIPVSTINIILIVLTAITVSLSMRVIGILLVGALMVIPVVTAMQVAKSFFQSVIFSVTFALFAVTSGLFIAYYFNLPAGGAIVLFSLAVFSGIFLVSRNR